ncbi:MAG: acylphosphatase [Methanobacteriota archaeon]
MVNNSLKQYRIIVIGKVQRVGFRDKVEDIAVEHRITGYVQNLSTRDVCIVAEGKDTDLERFCRAVQNCELPVKVSSMRVTECPYEGTYEDFIIIRGEPFEELAERFDNAIFYLHSIDTKQDQMLEKQDQMLDKQDQMLEKQDLSLGKQDKMLGKQDQMLETQKHTVDLQSKTLDEIHALRTDFTERFMHEVSEARAEIRELRNELVQAGVLIASGK